MLLVHDALEALLRLPHDIAVGVLDAQNAHRSRMHAQGGERGIGRHHFDRVDRARPNGNRFDPRNPRGEFEAKRLSDDRVDTDLPSELDGDQIPRLPQALPEGHRTAIISLEIARLPRLACLRLVDADRLVDDHVAGRAAGSNGGGKDERFERGSRLPVCLGRAVELGLLIVPPANHGAHVTGLCVHRDQGALQVRRHVGLGDHAAETIAVLLV